MAAALPLWTPTILQNLAIGVTSLVLGIGLDLGSMYETCAGLLVAPLLVLKFIHSQRRLWAHIRSRSGGEP